MEFFLFEVPSDRDGSGVVSGRGEVSAEFDDAVVNVFRRVVWVRFWAPGAWFDGVEAVCFGPGEEAVEVLSTESVCGGGLCDSEVAGEDFEDSDAVLGHGYDCRVCRDSCVACLVSLMS